MERTVPISSLDRKGVLERARQLHAQVSGGKVKLVPNDPRRPHPTRLACRALNGLREAVVGEQLGTVHARLREVLAQRGNGKHTNFAFVLKPAGGTAHEFEGAVEALASRAAELLR